MIQNQIINYVISNKDFSFIADNNLSAEYFTGYEREFEYIKNHYKMYGSVPDMTTFISVFKNFEPQEVTEPASYLLQEIREVHNCNVLISSVNKIRDLVEAGKGTEAANQLIKSLSSGIESSVDLVATNILEDISRYDEYIDKCTNFDKHFISTGFPELDDSLGGGIDRENALFVISARPGIGKTLALVKVAVAAVNRGLRVGLYEGEMTTTKIANRFDTLTSHISNAAIDKGNLSVANAYQQYLKTMQSNHKGAFYVLTRESSGATKFTVDTLASFVDKYSLDVLLVDQYSLIDSYNTKGKSFEVAAEISKELKLLQSSKKIPVIIASQLNRGAADDPESVGTQNLSLSDRLGQDATTVISLSRNQDIMTINIAKARDGAKVYKLSYMVDYDKGIFEYIPEETGSSYSAPPPPTDEDAPF